jgi:CheY-like chemotaxis protein
LNFLDNADFLIETYPTGELCVANLSNNPDVVILDYQLDGIVVNAMNGLETLDKVKEFNPETCNHAVPQDKIEVAINCMHHKALIMW